MEDKHKQILRINHKYLVDNLQVKEILTILYQKGLINDEEEEELETERTSFRAARKFLRIVRKKGPNAYDLLIETLEESENGDFIIEQLKTTDIGDHVDLDEPFDEEDKLQKFQEQLNKQTELLIQYMKDKDHLEKRVMEHEAVANDLKLKYGDIEKLLADRGVESGDCAEYLKEYLNNRDVPDFSLQYTSSPLASPTKKGMSSSPSFTFSTDDIRANSESLCEAVARDTGKDLVKFMVQRTFQRRVNRPSSKYSATMRKITDELITQHEKLLTKSLLQLNIDEINGFETFIKVADELFNEGEPNWGRIAVLYAFAGLMARHAAENGNEQMALFMGDFLGFYVAKKLGSWIEDHDGWDGFLEHFSEMGTNKDGVNWRTLLIAVAGIAGASAIVGMVTAHNK